MHTNHGECSPSPRTITAIERIQRERDYLTRKGTITVCPDDDEKRRQRLADARRAMLARALGIDDDAQPARTEAATIAALAQYSRRAKEPCDREDAGFALGAVIFVKAMSGVTR